MTGIAPAAFLDPALLAGISDLSLLARTVVDIGVATNPASGIYDQIVRVSPLHIVRIENLQAA